MQKHAPTGRIVRFGTFEVDLQEGRLTRSGLRVRLQGQPFHILTLLLERPGQVVSREEIRQKLWSEGTFVEFDDALNTAIRRLRAALGDNADNPRFLETVPRRGYRFLAPVTPLTERRAPSEPPQEPLLAPMIVKIAELAEINVEQPSIPRQRFSWRGALLAAAVLIVATAIGIYWRFRHAAFTVTSKDLIVVADFVNTTGETVFDDALRQGLEIGLEQSPAVTVLPERKASRILKQMGHAPEERMTGRSAVEVCQRAGGKVTVQGSISSLGTAYLLGLAAIRCDTGEPVANEQFQAKRKEEVVDALGRATEQLRSRLGESLPSIQKYDAPLELATTPSLDALNAYGLALSTWDKKGDEASLPIFKQAVALDPNFALAYGGLAAIYHNLGDSELARANATKAYELRAQVTQAEKASIEARYYSYVTGELEKTAAVRTLEVQDFPQSAGAWNHLGNVYVDLALYDQAAQALRHALLLDPSRGTTYSNLANVLFALNRVDDAAAVLADAKGRKLQSTALLQGEYWLAFLRKDTGAMRSLLQQATDPAAQKMLLAEAANTEAFYGHYARASELSAKAARLAEQAGDRESAATLLVQAALREAEIDEPARARALIGDALKLSRGHDVAILAALSLARLGDSSEAAKLGAQLSQEWPVATHVQSYWLPAIRAEIDIRRKQPLNAVADLQVANTPLEFASSIATAAATLYPAYIRGQAYLAAGKNAEAALEFQKFIDHGTLTVNSPLGSLARVGLARACLRQGDVQRARQNYQDFLALWKDADPGISILREAKAEYAKLP